MILLDQSTKEVGTVKIVCGTGLIELKGVPKGKVKVASLSADVEAGTFVFPGARNLNATRATRYAKRSRKKPS
jgi:hypothetical protein